MKETNAPVKIERLPNLRCPACGNSSRFIQVMEHVENLVDGNLNHLHLLIGVPDYYHCSDCGEHIVCDE
jgi:DNA-directed RNA polymerase subunit RPC12/RpoP